MAQLQCPVCSSPVPASATVCPTCGASLSDGAAGPQSTSPAALPPATRLNQGGFSVGRVLGRGGFGITYLGADLRLKRAVAIKEFFPSGSARSGTRVLPPAELNRQEFELALQKFMQEAQMLARFRHPSIVNVYEVFEENDTAYMVMEYLHGENLLERMEREGKPLEEPLLDRVVGPIAEALDEVHHGGILHRDIKPENIMLVGVEPAMRPVLIDFGAAREFASGMVNRHSIVLTPGYAPLEQYGEQAKRGPFTDVYALAATVYHVSTEQQPPAATERALGVDLKPPRSLNPLLSVPFDAAIMHGLEMKVADRPQTACEFYQELSGAASRVPVTAPMLPPSVPDVLPAAPAMPAPAPPAPSPAIPTTGTHMERVRQIARQLSAMGAVQSEGFPCPVCRRADMLNAAETVAGTICPVCHAAVLRQRFSATDLLLCPSCSTGTLQRVNSPPLNPSAMMRCPACHIGSIMTYFRGTFLPDVWARCDTCGADFDYHTQGDSLTLDTLPSGTGYLSPDDVGKTRTRSQWAALAGSGEDGYRCPVCSAKFSPCGGGNVQWVEGTGRSSSTAAQYRGQCRSEPDWTRIAHHLPAGQGTVLCPKCDAQFDQPGRGELTLLGGLQDPYGTIATQRGRTRTAIEWRALARGRRTGSTDGLVCPVCTAEMQAVTAGGRARDYMLIAYNANMDPHGVGARYQNHQLSADDWRRIAAGGLPRADERQLREAAHAELWKAFLAGEVSTAAAEDSFPATKWPGEKIVLTFAAVQLRTRFGFLYERDAGQTWLTTRRLLYLGDRDKTSIALRDTTGAEVVLVGQDGGLAVEIHGPNKPDLFRFRMAAGPLDFTLDGLALQLQWDEEAFVELFESLRRQA